ncbi:transglutaminase domain-containing protein [uncultured Anaerococcus sp.]|uniref:transglutaminase domain-containing protein n=1 Tax=uncultured Anaerococcus sp. TaxID=293428 RepID=UPI0026229A47|nr:transglutaminase domain-containing protein [uncultured Anaerococcus sp.]
MKNKIFAASLAAFLAISPVVNAPLHLNTAYAESNIEKIAKIDTSRTETTISAAKYLLAHSPNIFKDENKKYLENLIKESERLLAIVYKARDEVKATDNLNIRIKNIIRSNLDDRNTNFTVNVNAYTTNKQLQDWFLETAKEDWYFFYSMYGKTNVKTNYNPKKTKGDKVYVNSVTFNVEYREDPAIEKDVENFANQWVAENINSNDSDFTKALKIHDFIVTKNQYNRGDSKDMSGGYSIYHPASILYGNGGVCNAYATLFDNLVSKAGLDVRYATGTTKKTGEPHIWNMVKVDGNWYNLDATYDDPVITFNEGNVNNIGDFVIYDYFLKSDKEMERSRSIENKNDKPQALSSMDTGLKNSRIEMIDGEYQVIK